MTLLELCEPLFKYVCFLNRSVRKGAHLDAADVDSELERILGEIKSAARATPGLAEQYEKVELPLIYFVDNVIASSPYPFAESYQRLAYKPQRDVVAGDEEFCIELNNALKEPDSASVIERLAVLYTCVGLGFTGFELSDPAVRQQRMSQIARRIRPLLDSKQRERITPQAYEHTLRDNLVPPPVGPVWKVGLALAVFVVIVVVATGWLYKTRVGVLTTTLEQIK